MALVTLTGFVYDERGNAISGATVNVRLANDTGTGAIQGSDTTDANGRWDVTGVDDANWPFDVEIYKGSNKRWIKGVSNIPYSIQGVSIASSAITSAKIADGTISTADIGAQQITRSLIEETQRIPVGSIIPYGTSLAPTGWLICDGSAVNRVGTYADLFAVIGTTYGAGNGTTTFNLPNLKGKVVVGFDLTQTEFDVIGETGGAKTHTLTEAETRGHTHSVPGATITSGGNSVSHVHEVNPPSTTSGSNNASHTHDTAQQVIASGVESANHTHGTAQHNLTSAVESADHTHVIHSGGTTTAAEGSHTHNVSGNTASDGTHTHTNATFLLGTAGGAANALAPAGAGTTESIESTGSAHLHAISLTSAAGTVHSHSISQSTSTGTSGTHTHAVTVPATTSSVQSLNHTHSVTVAASTTSAQSLGHEHAVDIGPFNSEVNNIGHSHQVVYAGGTTGSTGGSAAHNNLQPYITLQYIIKF
jgi:microcystin-dependent protein